MKKLLHGLICLLILVAPILVNAQNLLDGPEHASHDPARDRYIISSWANGAVVAIDYDGVQSNFITGLPQALGHHIVDDTLYISVGKSIRAYDLNTAALLWSAMVPYSSQMDGMVSDTSGNLFIANVDQTGAGLIFKLNIETHLSEIFVTAGQLPSWPQDLAFDPENNRLLLASYTVNAPLLAIDAADASVSTLVITPFGKSDGIIMDNDGNIYMTCYSTGCIYRYGNTPANPPVLVSNGHTGPAGLGYNKAENILVVPNFGADRVDFLPLLDSDGDDVIDIRDNCPFVANFDQTDTDGDGDGDVCDGCPVNYNPEHEDVDGDSVEDACDNCPEHPNPGQEDTNGNGVGDPCDYVCGDIDGKVGVDILDIVFLINNLYKSGADPEPMESADVNHDYAVNILDAVYLINFVYKGGADPECVVW